MKIALTVFYINMKSVFFTLHEYIAKASFIYSKKVLIYWGIGYLLWISVYWLLIRSARKNNKVEIPLILIPLNISWEFCWSFLLEGPLGYLHKTGSQIWLILDLLILYYAFKLNPGLIQNKIKQAFINVCLFIIGCSFVCTVNKYFKDDVGLVSGYCINLVMSIVYCYGASGKLFISSKKLAFIKFLGTLFMSIGVVALYTNIRFLIVVTIWSISCLDLWCFFSLCWSNQSLVHLKKYVLIKK